MASLAAVVAFHFAEMVLHSSSSLSLCGLFSQFTTSLISVSAIVSNSIYKEWVGVVVRVAWANRSVTSSPTSLDPLHPGIPGSFQVIGSFGNSVLGIIHCPLSRPLPQSGVTQRVDSARATGGSESSQRRVIFVSSRQPRLRRLPVGWPPFHVHSPGVSPCTLVEVS